MSLPPCPETGKACERMCLTMCHIINEDRVALRARVAEARGLLDRATQLLREDGAEYSLLSDIEDWLHPSAGAVHE
jgi:hypothetical protein